MRANTLSRYRRLLRAVSLGLAAFAVVSVTGCATWRESPQGAMPRKLDAPQKVEMSFSTNEELNVVGTGTLMVQQFLDAGYTVNAVMPDAPVKPDTIRLDLTAAKTTSGGAKAGAIVSGMTLTLIPAYWASSLRVDGTVTINGEKRPYSHVGAAKLFVWLPLILIAPFQTSEGGQIDGYFRDVGRDLVRVVQTMGTPTAAPVVAPAPQ